MRLIIEYINHYHCEGCNIDWQTIWDCACNDKCPHCNTEHEPFKSDELIDFGDTLKSYAAGKMIECISKRLIMQIKKFLDEKMELEFEEQVNLHAVDETIDGIFKREDGYHIATTDTKSGDGLFYDLEDVEIVTQDLVWIMEQIEINERG